MKRKALFIGLIMVLCTALALIASGCGQTEAEGEHEAITIIDAQRDYTAFVELVHEKYPEINIEIIPYRGRNMSAFMKQQLETGELPDIYTSSQAWDPELQAANLIDLSQYDVAGLYSEARLTDYYVDGALYLLPFDYSISGMLCNKTLLDANGIEVPTSFKELREVTIPALKENGIRTAVSLLDLPGSAFQFFFNISGTNYMNTVAGREWRSQFTDVDSDVFASDNEELITSAKFFQEWIDQGMLVDDKLSETYGDTVNTFYEGNTAFLIGTVQRFHQNEDGTGDEYVIVPFLSEDGTSNSYCTSPGRFYGLNKELAEEGNEQKLEDALHVLEVLSSNEGYLAIHGEYSTNMCSIKEFEVAEDSPYAEAVQEVANGHSMNLVYTGWDGYLVPFGEAAQEWIGGRLTLADALKVLDDTKKDLQKNGVKSYATATEVLDTVQVAHLSGQIFMDATGADAALISYNVYDPSVPALRENSQGANGKVLTGPMTEEYITAWLPTGWYDTLRTAELTGARIKELAAEGADTSGTGFYYPYVLMSASGQDLADDETYTVVFAGYSTSVAEETTITDTGIVGLDAAKAYLEKVGEVSSKTLDESMVLKAE